MSGTGGDVRPFFGFRPLTSRIQVVLACGRTYVRGSMASRQSTPRSGQAARHGGLWHDWQRDLVHMATPRRLFDAGSTTAGLRRTARPHTDEPRPARRLWPVGVVRPDNSGRPAGLRVVLTRYLAGAVVLL